MSTPPPASPGPVTGLMTHGEGGGEAARARGVMFVNLKKAMCGQAACAGRQHRQPATGEGTAMAALAPASQPGKALDTGGRSLAPLQGRSWL